MLEENPMPVHMSLSERLHRSYGSALHGFVITNLLERTQPEFGIGLVKIHVELVYRAPSRIDAPIETSEVIMGTPIANLPVGKLSPTAKQYSLTALSRWPGDEPLRMNTGVTLISREDFQREAARQQAENAARTAELASRRADITAVPRLFDEVANALATTPPMLKPSAFDWAAFVAWFRSLRSELPTTLEDIEAADAAGHAAAQARRGAMDPWALLDIDWNAFHPDARILLPDPFFWSGDDDFAPHGNDEGFDVLAQLRKSQRTERITEITFAALAQQFEHPSEYEIAKTDDIDTTRYLEFMVAVAFGHIKLQGFCPKWLSDKALAAMKYEIATLDAHIARDSSGVQLSPWDAAMAPRRSARRDSLKRLMAALKRMPSRAPS